MDKEKAKERISQLVKEFSEIPEFEINDKKEDQIKWLFIEPLLDALGWEKKDIEKEASVLNGRADYLLRDGNQEAFVVEAKKTSVHLSEEEGKQAVSYAYHRKMKFAVLTNFKYIRVYHALSNIRKIDHNLLFWLDFKDFASNFDKLWLLSKESFEKGELEKLIPSKDQKTAVPIDERILEDLLRIREWLSKELKSKRMALKDESVDEIVQIFIDRLIFMRSVEDRGLEAEDFLLKIMQSVQQGESDKNLWALLKEQFARFDRTYNSKLFASGMLEEYGFFSDDVLKKIIKTLYYGLESTQEKYMFNQIPGDLFGSIYEQYLGTILSGTEKRVKLEGGTGKRKKMGIYYTPSYIVDYIIKNTVYEYIKDKSLDEILEVKILDPACGSGSFITRAFVEVCNVVMDKLNNGEKSQKWSSFKEPTKALNFSQKSTILKNCIYGVDLDEKAVELAQLNLLLKCLEGETRDLKNRKLPNLLENIKCGNSLISDSKFDKAFNWNAQFPEAFKDGGFDVVIGNPPYIRNRELRESDKVYLNKNFLTAKGQWDIYQLFFEKSIQLMKDGAFFGFITSNKYAITSAGKDTRKFLLDNTSIKEIIDVSNFSVFKDASTYPFILIFRKGKGLGSEGVFVSRVLSEKELPTSKSVFISQGLFYQNEDFVFDINPNKMNKSLLEKINANSELLGNMAIIKETVHTGNIREKILLDKKENDFCKKILRGKDCQRYHFNWNGLWINTNPAEISKKKGEYATIPDKSFFEKPKIFLREIAEKITCCFDDEGFYSLNKAYVVLLRENSLPLKVLLGLLNSKLLSWFFRIKFESAHVRGGHLQFKKQYTSHIPIKIPQGKQSKRIEELVERIMKFYQEKKSEQDIMNVDYEIDQEVYKLYELTPEEIKIVEESVK